MEIAPSQLPITIHIVRPDSQRRVLTLFTTGMSETALQAPAGRRASTFAELFLQLPSDWDYTQFKDPRLSWPLVWLRRLAKYPSANNAWLEHPLTIISMKGTEEIAPGKPFDSFLLFAQHEVPAVGGGEIYRYRVLPLHPQERRIEKRAGAPALMQAFDRGGARSKSKSDSSSMRKTPYSSLLRSGSPTSKKLDEASLAMVIWKSTKFITRFRRSMSVAGCGFAGTAAASIRGGGFRSLQAGCVRQIEGALKSMRKA